MASLSYKALSAAEDFLQAYPGMSLQPIRDDRVVLCGVFSFSAESKQHGLVNDSFELRMEVPSTFPKDLPVVFELGGRIPREKQYHVNPGDCSLCVGSRLRLLTILARAPTLIGFAQNCLIPYLYAISLKLAQGGGFVFGELPHGWRGEVLDYADLLGLDTADQVIKAICYLGMKKRRANKQPCPCQCGRRLGVCALNERIRRLRKLAERAWFHQLHLDLMRNDSSLGPFNLAVSTALTDKTRKGKGVRNHWLS